MNVDGTPYHSIWFDPATDAVKIIDQRWLPHEFRIARLQCCEEAARAIAEMWVRGAPLIGATAAWGLALQMADDASDAALAEATQMLEQTRPTAVNLRWALETLSARLAPLPVANRATAARDFAANLCREDIDRNRRIGEHGLALLRELARRKPRGEPINVLTHCNAGWLATVDWGTATAPIYRAVDAGIDVHVLIDETRPRNQGAQLTAWELAKHGVPHHLIVDNAGGYLMQQGEVDMVITGTDRTTANGDVCNKIGTYLKALAAHDNGIPFYVALPSPTIDWQLDDGSRIPVEVRDAAEVTEVQGRLPDGTIGRVHICPDTTPAWNPAFDVTPARLISGLITERGVCPASTQGLTSLFPEKRQRTA